MIAAWNKPKWITSEISLSLNKLIFRICRFDVWPYCWPLAPRVVLNKYRRDTEGTNQEKDFLVLFLAGWTFIAPAIKAQLDIYGCHYGFVPQKEYSVFVVVQVWGDKPLAETLPCLLTYWVLIVLRGGGGCGCGQGLPVLCFSPSVL